MSVEATLLSVLGLKMSIRRWVSPSPVVGEYRCWMGPGINNEAEVNYAVLAHVVRFQKVFNIIVLDHFELSTEAVDTKSFCSVLIWSRFSTFI